jgi:hypothetical protein
MQHGAAFKRISSFDPDIIDKYSGGQFAITDDIFVFIMVCASNFWIVSRQPINSRNTLQRRKDRRYKKKINFI